MVEESSKITAFSKIGGRGGIVALDVCVGVFFGGNPQRGKNDP